MFYEQAESCYARATSLEPASWRWVYYRALIRADRGGGDALLADLRHAVELQPQFAPAWLRLGDAEFKAGRYEAAEAAWARAADLPEPPRAPGTPRHHVETPVAAYARIGLARLRLAGKDLASATEILQKVTADAPAFVSGFRLLAEAYTAAGRAGDAKRALYHAGRLPPFAPYADPLIDDLARESRNSTFLLRLASEADLSVNAEWSEYLTRRALEFDPDNPEVVKKLARVLSTVGRSGEALPYFRRYHEMVPGDYEGLAQLGSCLSDLGRYEEAEPILRRALEGLDDAQTHYNLGLLLARTARFGGAVEAYGRALARDPHHANARINLAVVRVREGRLDAAEQELTRVLARDPENALAHTNLGLVLAQQGQAGQAARAFREALRIDPTLAPAAEALRELRGRE
jgi:tetratricopeptide (TPR) repeat protein